MPKNAKQRNRRPRTDRWWWAKVVVSMATGAAALTGGVGVAGADQGVDQTGFYVMTDSTEPGGPVYDAQEVATNLVQTDESEATVTLPFPFRFYGTTHTSVTVGANGALEFPAGEQVAPTNQALDQADNRMIAPWWDNWRPGNGGQGVVRIGTVGDAPHRRFVASWLGVTNEVGLGAASFQVQLFEGSNRIEFHYIDTDSLFAGSGGTLGTVGIDDGTTSALQYALHEEVLTNHLAIRFSPALCAGRPVTRLGTPGPDTITTGGGDDVVLALGGDDVIRTGAGDDLVCAAGGNDRVNGGGGDDRALGGQGTDDLAGDGGADRLAGGLGDDTCRGGPGQDTATGCEARASLP